MKTISKTFFLVLLLICCANWVRPQTPGPTLLTQENSSRAAALDSVMFARDPLPVVARSRFSEDWRTRLTLFGINMELMPGETASAVTAKSRDSKSRIHTLNVEFVGKVPGFDWLSQAVVKLSDDLAQAGDVWISVTLRGQTSNEVLFNVEVQPEPRRATLVARRVINGHDTYVDAAFSFELGMNGEDAMSLTRNDWDILFGNSPDIDTFTVSLVGDDRSRIQDLGALNWGDAFQVPVLTPHPMPAIEPDVTAVVGHIYVVHNKDTETDLYTLFRVEALDPKNSVTISWKNVQAP